MLNPRKEMGGRGKGGSSRRKGGGVPKSACKSCSVHGVRQKAGTPECGLAPYARPECGINVTSSRTCTVAAWVHPYSRPGLRHTKDNVSRRAIGVQHVQGLGVGPDGTPANRVLQPPGTRL